MPAVDPRQLVVLATVLLVPSVLIIWRRDDLLLLWIGLAVGVNIFDTHVFVNLPAARVAGLLLLPRTVPYLPRVLRTLPGQSFVAWVFYLVLLGLFFGFLFPWPDDGLLRTFNQLPAGRSTVYAVRTLSDLSLVLFVAACVEKRGSALHVLLYALAGTTVAAAGGLVEAWTRVDLYGTLTGLRALSIEHRMRGFNYEPRGLGLIAVHGMLFSAVLYAHRGKWKYMVLVGLHAVAALMTGSTSAVIAGLAGTAAIFIWDPRVRPAIVAVSLVVALTVASLWVGRWGYLRTFEANARIRLSAESVDRPPRNVVEDVAFRMGVFDGPALLFLADRPEYLIIGAGPGMVSLPATLYTPPSVYFDWTRDTGINTPPTMGLLLEISNTGLVGGLLLALFVVGSLRAFKRLSRGEAGRDWRIAGSAFVVAAAVFAVQSSPLSAIWPLFAGTAVGAGCVRRRQEGVGTAAGAEAG